jgi:hypothetical protein
MLVKRIKEYVILLRNGNPEAWTGFLAAMTTASSEFDTAAINADPADILRKQGHAQAYRQFIEILKDCDKA